ncbi:MAG: right-handed parallel beta-helix repeat-containing protein [Bryobacteraceae bacterium]|nr:right-handed parallel beta-helix repeat-containing protein [Bryobacteraceae bacterium]
MCRLRLSFLAAALLASGATYYVDCESGSDAAAGTSPQAAWRTLQKVAVTTFVPGDSILLRRGTRCQGILWPKGSGAEGRPIRISAYGSGALPLIEAGGQEAAIKLYDQQYWHVENLHTRGGNPYGVVVSGTAGVLRHFRLRNLLVEDVGGQVKTKASGLVAVLAPESLRMEDVVIDGVTARNTTQWAGIIVQGGSRENPIRGVVVRNAIVHQVYGDGIVLFQVADGLIEHSAAWLTGLNPSAETGTPNGIWTWRCRNCTVRRTEGFFTDSPGVDGGVYDIDWGNDDNVVEHNYAHDAQGYCASVFGAHGEVTTNSTVRYNVCVNNGRSPKLARRQGDLYITTWEGGALDGILVHNNTFYWTPPIDAPAVQMDHADFRGDRPNVFRNNVIFSAVPSMIRSNRSLRFEANVYWYPGGGEPVWRYGDNEYRGIEAWRLAAGSEEVWADPRWDAMLRPQPGSPLLDPAARLRAGAIEPGGRALPAAPPRLAVPGRSRDRWLLLLLSGSDPEVCRSQLVFVQAALAQYGDSVLESLLEWEGPAEGIDNLAYDWRLGAVRFARGLSLRRFFRGASAQGMMMALVDPIGRVRARWDGSVRPAELGLTLRYHLGPPPGAGARHPLWPVR